MAAEADLRPRLDVDQAHLGHCGACARWQADLLAMRQALAQAPMPALPPHFSADLDRRLREVVAPRRSALSRLLAGLAEVLTPPRLVLLAAGGAALAGVLVLTPSQPDSVLLHVDIQGASMDQAVAVNLDLPKGVVLVGPAPRQGDWMVPAGQPLDIELTGIEGAGGPVGLRLSQGDRQAVLQLSAQVGPRASIWDRLASDAPAGPSLSLSSTVSNNNPAGPGARNLEDPMISSARTLSLVAALALSGPALADTPQPVQQQSSAMDDAPSAQEPMDTPAAPPAAPPAMHAESADMQGMMDHAMGMDAEDLHSDGMMGQSETTQGHGLGMHASADAVSADAVPAVTGSEAMGGDTHDGELQDGDMHDGNMHDDVDHECDGTEMGGQMEGGGMEDHMGEGHMDDGHMGSDGMGSDGMGSGGMGG
ncbi:MAG: hypothetical protein GXP62_09725 [Oligoflexia bacterium]|nr:hypothetical protein [Oligoflexia bacterium]